MSSFLFSLVFLPVGTGVYWKTEAQQTQAIAYSLHAWDKRVLEELLMSQSQCKRSWEIDGKAWSTMIPLTVGPLGLVWLTQRDRNNCNTAGQPLQ